MQEKQLILITAMVPTQLSSISDATETENREKKLFSMWKMKKDFLVSLIFLQ